MSAFDAVRLARAIERFEAEAGRDGARRLAILHRGDLVHAGPEADRAQGVWSITKTILSTTLGLLVDDGRVALDQPVTRVLPELAAAFSDATFRHFASMTFCWLPPEKAIVRRSGSIGRRPRSSSIGTRSESGIGRER